MTEREHCEAVADAWVATVETHRRIFEREKLVSSLADILARERAAARDQALEEARVRLCGIEHDADYPESVSPCACAAIRELKAKP